MDKLDFSMEDSWNDTVSDLVWYFLPIAAAVPPLGLPANALVIRLLLGKPGICSTSEIFTLNLAVFDLLFCILILIEYTILLFRQADAATNFLAWGLNQAGGPMLLCISGLDSYLAVCHPLVFLRLKEPNLRLSLCLAVCAVTVACCGIVKFSSKYKWKLIMGILWSTIAVISACNVMILKSLCKSGPSGKKVHPVKRRAFKLVLTAFALVIVHYVPPAVEYMLRKYGGKDFKPYSIVTAVSYGILSWGSVTQPLTYLVRTKQLAKATCPVTR